MVMRLLSSDKAAIAIATEEYLEIHRLLDKVRVARRINDQVLTAAQRVGELVGRIERLEK